MQAQDSCSCRLLGQCGATPHSAVHPCRTPATPTCPTAPHHGSSALVPPPISPHWHSHTLLPVRSCQIHRRLRCHKLLPCSPPPPPCPCPSPPSQAILTMHHGTTRPTSSLPQVRLVPVPSSFLRQQHTPADAAGRLPCCTRPCPHPPSVLPEAVHLPPPACAPCSPPRSDRLHIVPRHTHLSPPEAPHNRLSPAAARSSCSPPCLLRPS